MSFSSLRAEDPRLAMFTITRASDAAELDGHSRMSDRLPGQSREYRYMLQDRALWRRRFDSPILSVAIRRVGPMLASYGKSRFAIEVGMDGDECEFFGFSTPLQGEMTLIKGGNPTTVTASRGLVFRAGPSVRLVTSDDSVRTNVFIKVVEVMQALEEMLDQRLRAPLAFEPSLDWNSGLAASLKAQLDFMLREFGREDGIASNAAALASMTDLLMALVLRCARHNYSDQLQHRSGSVMPLYVRRAEEFMLAQCATPIRVSDIAAAAGCSVRTLNAVFQRFRARVPLAVLQAIRLQQVHVELSRAADAVAIGEIARRHGFTNSSRFNLEFRRRFGETPRDVARRALRL